MLIVTVPILAICTFCTVNIIINFGREIAAMFLIIAGVCVAFGIIFAFAAAYFTDKKIRRHSRFTYFDFLPKGMIFSEYAGEFTRYGKRIILRRLCYIPFETFESVSRNPNAPHDISFKGEIREYLCDSKRLGYHIFEDGELVFDSFELNFGHFEKLSALTVKDRFGNTRRLEKAVNYYLKRYKNAPKKKPFDIKDYVAVAKKRKPKTSNPALELPSYNRKW